MKNLKKRALSVVLLFGLLIALCPTAFALESQPGAELVGEGQVRFSNLSLLAPNESIQCVVKDCNGNLVTVGIEAVSQSERRTNRAGGLTHRVWYSSIYISAEFYMDVFSNRVTSVYDDSITVRGGSYENEVLTQTSTYGKLTFDTTTAIGGVTGKCWLKGTVTGSDDEITVDWKM